MIRDFTIISNSIINAESAIAHWNFFIGNAVVSNTVVPLDRRHRLMRLDADIEMRILLLRATRISHDTRATVAVIIVAGIYHWYIELGLRMVLLVRRRGRRR